MSDTPSDREIIEGVINALRNSPEVSKAERKAVKDRLEEMSNDEDAPYDSLADANYDAVDFAMEMEGVPREDRMAIIDELQRGRLT